MPRPLMERLRRPSLRTALLAIILMATLPTLGVAIITLTNAARSLQGISTQQLLESAHTVAQSTSSELGATERLLTGLMRHAINEDGPDRANALAFFEGMDGDYTIYHVQNGKISPEPADSATLAALILDATSTGRVRISNILPQADGSNGIHIAIAVPGVATRSPAAQQVVTPQTPPPETVVVVTVAPNRLIRSLSRQEAGDGPVVLAITDGMGRIIGRSLDGDKFIGKPVPDWQKLLDLGTDSGSFRAQTLEGRQIVFAFQRIDGTPGWTAVTGEPVHTFDWRWQGPILAMIVASLITVSIALAAALLIAHRALRPIRSLVRRAQMIGTGAPRPDIRPPQVPPSFIKEFETLRRSLEAADETQRRHLSDLCAKEAALRKSYVAQQEAER
ncbi:MAG TPA: hypothetical protein VGC31_02680, partial [Paenirhodobacter sp.]